MPEPNDDDIDRAYRTAVDTTEDVAAVRRRTRGVLAAVQALEAAQATQGVRQGGRTRLQVSTGWWRGLAAACVIGASALMAVHLSESPEVIVQTEVRSDNDRARLAELADRADRAAPTSTPDPTRSRAEQPRPSSSRPERSSAKSRESLAGEPVLPSSAAPAAARAAADVAVASPPAADAGSPSGPAAQAPRGGLLAAATMGDFDAARRALGTTHPDAERDADGRTALAIAVLRSNVPLAKLLLESGSDPDQKDRFGQTPRSYAESVGEASMLEALERR